MGYSKEKWPILAYGTELCLGRNLKVPKSWQKGL